MKTNTNDSGNDIEYIRSGVGTFAATPVTAISTFTYTIIKYTNGILNFKINSQFASSAGSSNLFAGPANFFAANEMPITTGNGGAPEFTYTMPVINNTWQIGSMVVASYVTTNSFYIQTTTSAAFGTTGNRGYLAIDAKWTVA